MEIKENALGILEFRSSDNSTACVYSFIRLFVETFNFELWLLAMAMTMTIALNITLTKTKTMTMAMAVEP